MKLPEKNYTLVLYKQILDNSYHTILTIVWFFSYWPPNSDDLFSAPCILSKPISIYTQGTYQVIDLSRSSCAYICAMCICISLWCIYTDKPILILLCKCTYYRLQRRVRIYIYIYINAARQKWVHYNGAEERYKSPRRRRKEEKGRSWKPIVVVVVIISTSTDVYIIRQRMVYSCCTYMRRGIYDVV